MSAGKHKYPAIDLLKLEHEWGAKEWHGMLMKAIREQDLNKLSKTLYGIQRGMSILAKDGTNTPYMCERFAEWTRQIEVAAKKIFRKRHPSVLDTGIRDFVNPGDTSIAVEHRNKRLRDEEFRKFLARSRY